jgi:hypothetical protein
MNDRIPSISRGPLRGVYQRSERHRISAAGAVPRAERYGGFSNRSGLLSVEANADAKDGLWRKAVIRLLRKTSLFIALRCNNNSAGRIRVIYGRERTSLPCDKRCFVSAFVEKSNTRDYERVKFFSRIIFIFFGKQLFRIRQSECKLEPPPIFETALRCGMTP